MSRRTYSCPSILTNVEGPPIASPQPVVVDIHHESPSARFLARGQKLIGSALSHVCYVCNVAEVASRELRNDTRALLRRVASGEDIVITVDGRPVAALRPLNQRPRWASGRDLARRLARRQADPDLLSELRDLAPDTTDDLPL